MQPYATTANLCFIFLCTHETNIQNIPNSFVLRPRSDRQTVRRTHHPPRFRSGSRCPHVDTMSRKTRGELNHRATRARGPGTVGKSCFGRTGRGESSVRLQKFDRAIDLIQHLNRCRRRRDENVDLWTGPGGPGGMKGEKLGPGGARAELESRGKLRLVSGPGMSSILCRKE